jgi:hypothetical protein
MSRTRVKSQNTLIGGSVSGVCSLISQGTGFTPNRIRTSSAPAEYASPGDAAARSRKVRMPRRVKLSWR